MTAKEGRLRLALLLGGATLAAALHPDQPGLDCGQGGRNQIEVNACAALKADAVKKRLAALLAELDGVLQPEVRERLGRVQARWAEVRDLDCGWERDLFEGGSVAPLVYANCVARQTE